MLLSWNPVVFGLVLLLGILYHTLTGSLRTRWVPSSQAPTTAQRTRFAMALAIYFLCVGSPLNIWATQDLYSAHMVQVAFLTLVVPPLVYRGLPDGLLGSLYQRATFRRIVRTAGHPLLALVTFNLIMWAWQYPVLLDWTLRNNAPYVLGTLLIMVSAFFLWWPIYTPRDARINSEKSLGARQLLAHSIDGPLNFEAQMMYWFLNFDLMMPPTIYVIDTTSPFYAVYEKMPHLFGLTALSDQQLGGLIMGLSMAIAYAIAFASAFSHYDMSAWYA